MTENQENIESKVIWELSKNVKMKMDKTVYEIKDKENKFPYENIETAIDNEEWLPHPDYTGKDYEVSTFGRIRKKVDGKYHLVPQHDPENNGYLYMTKNNFNVNGKPYEGSLNQTTCVYRFVAETWLSQENAEKICRECRKYRNCNKGLQVHHIDNNGYNNKIENLVWVTACQHSAIHSGLKKLEQRSNNG